MASDVRRFAAKQVVMLIDGWIERRTEGVTTFSPEVRAEMLRLKETFENVAAAVDPSKPEGWSEGDPMVGVCNCNECVDKKTKAAKEAGKLKDPT